MRLVHLIFCALAAPAAAQVVGGSSFSDGETATQSPIVGQWDCLAEAEFGSITSAVAYFPTGYGAGTFVIELTEPQLTATLFATSRWSFQGETLIDTLTGIKVLSLEAADLAVTPEVLASFEGSFLEDPESQSRLTAVGEGRLIIQDLQTGDETTCDRR